MGAVAELIIFGGHSAQNYLSDYWTIYYSSCLAYGFGNLAAQCINHTWYASTTSFVNSGDFTLTTDSIVIDSYSQASTGILNIDVTDVRIGSVNTTTAHLSGTLNVNITTPQNSFLILIHGNITGNFDTVNIAYPYKTSCTMQTQTTPAGFGILFSDGVCTSNSNTIIIAASVAVGGALLLTIAIIVGLMIYMRVTHNSWVYYKQKLRKTTLPRQEMELVTQ